MTFLFLAAALAAQPRVSGDFTLMMKGLVVGEESWTEGETWGRPFFRVDDDGSLEAAMIPTPYAPLVAVRKGRESEYGAVLAAAARAGLAEVSSTAERKNLAIVGASVLDVTNGSFRKSATVVVRDGRIDAIGDAGLAIPEDAERIEADGLALLPGLWDMGSSPSIAESRCRP